MTSLSETYGARGSRARKRLLAGTGLFLSGAVMIVAGIVIGSTDVLAAYGIETFGAREIAGILGGLGVPAVFVGVFIVLPASRGKRAAAAIGAGIALVGVVLFSYAYPDQWSRAYGSPETNLTLPVATVYVSGVLTTFWVLFTAIVNVKANSPSGTVRLQRIIRQAAGSTEPGSHRPGSKPSGRNAGSVGISGGIDGGRSEASQNSATSDGGTEAERLRTPGSSTGRADGPPGATGASGVGPPASEPTGRTDPSIGGSAGPTDTGNRSTGESAETDAGSATLPGGTATAGSETDPDRYCGNCGHFQYVRAEAGMQPYCGFHDELMDDMEACEQWEANTASVDRRGRQ